MFIEPEQRLWTVSPILLSASSYLQIKHMWIGSLNVVLGVDVMFQSVILQRNKFDFDCWTFECANALVFFF